VYLLSAMLSIHRFFAADSCLTDYREDAIMQYLILYILRFYLNVLRVSFIIKSER